MQQQGNNLFLSLDSVLYRYSSSPRTFLPDDTEQMARQIYNSCAKQNLIKPSKNVTFSKSRLVKVQSPETEHSSVAWETSFEAFNSKIGKKDRFFLYISPASTMKDSSGKNISPVAFIVNQSAREQLPRPVVACNEDITFTNTATSKNYLYYDMGHSGDAASDADVYSPYEIGIQYENTTEYTLNSKGISENSYEQQHRFFIDRGEDEYFNPYIYYVDKGSGQEKYIIENLKEISQTGKAPAGSNISPSCVKNMALINKALQKCGEKIVITQTPERSI